MPLCLKILKEKKILGKKLQLLLNKTFQEIIDDYKENLRIQKVVDEAIKNERFEVFLQPIYDLKKNSE